MNVLVLGGTGVISRAIVSRLLEKEHAVTIYNRGTRTLCIQRAGPTDHRRPPGSRRFRVPHAQGIL